MMQTLYRPVPGYEDLYAGIDASIVKAGVGELEQKLYPGARYLQVVLGTSVEFVHTLMAAAYLGERPEGMQVRHGEAGRLANTPDNLCYGTARDNMADAIAAGTHGSLIHKAKTHCSQRHEFTPENTYIVPGTDWRQCRQCRSDIDKRRQDRRKTGIKLPPRVTKADARRARIAQRQAKNDLIDRLLRESPDLSNRAIARQVGVGHQTVASRRKMLGDN